MSWENFVRFGIDLGSDKQKKKTPRFPKNWQNIKQSLYDNEANFAVLTGEINDIIVVDIDTKNDMPGDRWFRENFGDYSDLGTLVTKSWSGGYHIFFRYTDEVVSQSWGDLCIDIQSDGRCVYQGKNYDILYPKDCYTENLQDEIRLLTESEIKKLNCKQVIKNIKKELQSGYDKTIKQFLIDKYFLLSNRYNGTHVEEIDDQKYLIVSLTGTLCPIAKREHQSNHQYIVIGKEHSHIKCHDSECDGYKDQISCDNYPDYLKKLLESVFKSEIDENLLQKAFAECDNFLKNSNVGKVEDYKYNSENGEIIASGDNKTNDLLKLVGNGKCEVCQGQHQFTVNGYVIRCPVCNARWPNENYMLDRSQYPNINNLLIQNNFYGEQEVIIDDIDEVLFSDPIKDKLYKTFILYENTKNLLNILKYEIGEDDPNYIYSSEGLWYEWCETYGNRANIKDKRWRRVQNTNLNNEIDKISQECINLKKNIQDKTLKTTIHKIIKNLGNGITTKNVLDMWKNEEIDYEIDSIVNSHNKIVAFRDGILDLNTFEFRKSKKSDYITNDMYLDVKYKKKINVERLELVKKFFNDILPIEEREYLLTILSTCLTGNILQNVFVLEGRGGNGKSVLAKLVHDTFGTYSYQPKSQIATRKSENANEANSALAKFRDKRVIMISEPNEKEQLQTDKLKMWTGGEPISCRNLHQNETEFQPRFKLFILCNDKPKLSTNDGGIKRRLKVIRFPYQFTDPNKANYKQGDPEISEKLGECKREFVELLLEYYKRYLEQGIIEPQSVRELADEYLEDSKDIKISKFIYEHITRIDVPRNIKTKEELRNYVLTRTHIKQRYYDLYPNDKVNIDSLLREIENTFGIHEYSEGSQFNKIKFRGLLGLKFLN